MTRSLPIVGFVLFIWIVISFVTNIIGPVMPIIIDHYSLSLTMAAFLPFSFFLAYGIASIPASMLVEKWGFKKAMLVAFGVNFLGCLSFYLIPVYAVALGALFVIGIGMAMLQVIINPLMRTAGGEENFAFYSVMGQLVFGLASFLSPFAFTYFVTRLPFVDDAIGITAILQNLAPDGLPWVLLYGLFASVFVLLLVIVSTMRLKGVEIPNEERAEDLSVYRDLLKKRHVWLFFLGLIAYVGTEQGIATWMSEFLNVVHGVDPETTGAVSVGRFWGLMSVGCLVGLLVLKILDSRIVLRIFTGLAIVGVLAAFTGSKDVALIAFPALGFFISVMFSIIFSLALNSMQSHHGAFSGILCTGIFGGALIPLLVGILGDWIGIRAAMFFLLIPILYIGAISFWARPLIENSRFKRGAAHTPQPPPQILLGGPGA